MLCSAEDGQCSAARSMDQCSALMEECNTASAAGHGKRSGALKSAEECTKGCTKECSGRRPLLQPGPQLLPLCCGGVGRAAVLACHLHARTDACSSRRAGPASNRSCDKQWADKFECNKHARTHRAVGKQVLRRGYDRHAQAVRAVAGPQDDGRKTLPALCLNDGHTLRTCVREQGHVRAFAHSRVHARLGFTGA